MKSEEGKVKREERKVKSGQRTKLLSEGFSLFFIICSLYLAILSLIYRNPVRRLRSVTGE